MSKQFKIEIIGDVTSFLGATAKSNQAMSQMTAVTKEGAAELERYRKKMDEMAAAQAKTGKQQGSEEAAWMQGMAERRAALGASEVKQVEELAEKTEFLTLKKGELKKVLGEIGREFPLIGTAARAMFSPITAAVAGAVAVFGLAKKALDDWNRAMDETAARNASKDFLPGIEAKAAALADARTQANEFSVSLKKIVTAEDEVSTAIKNATDKLREFVNAQAEVNNAAEARDLANVDMQQKLGRIDESTATSMRADIRIKYRKQADELKTRTENEELRLQEEELARQKGLTPSLQESATSAQANMAQLRAKRAQAAKDLEEGKKKALEAEEELQKKLDEEQEAENRYGELRKFSGPIAADAAMARTREATAAARRRRDLQSGLNARNEGFISMADEMLLPEARARLGESQSALTGNIGRISQLEGELPLKRETLGIRQQGRAISGALTAEAAQMGAVGDLAQQEQQLGRSLESTAGAGKGLSEAMIRTVDKMRQELEETERALNARLRSLENGRKITPQI